MEDAQVFVPICIRLLSLIPFQELFMVNQTQTCKVPLSKACDQKCGQHRCSKHTVRIIEQRCTIQAMLHTRKRGCS